MPAILEILRVEILCMVEPKHTAPQQWKPGNVEAGTSANIGPSAFES